MHPPLSSAPAPPSERTGLPHLWPTALAVLAAVLFLATLDRMARARIARRAIHLAALNLPENSRGIALQRQLTTQPDCLMVYGSSELSQFQPTRADLFFRRHPSGFRPVVIGQPGDRCLLILQELAALGERARGRKFVIFLSPNWFLTPMGQHGRNHQRRLFVRDFSPVQASVLLVNGQLDHALKERIARRLLDSRDVIEESSPLLAYALDTLQVETQWQSGLFRLLQPLLALESGVLCEQDRWDAAHLTPPHRPDHRLIDDGPGQPPDWPELMYKMDADLALHGFSTPYSLDLPADTPPPFLTEPNPLSLYPRGDDAFRARLDASKDWTDLELLLQTIRSIGARVLLVGQPFNASVYDACQVSAQARTTYYGRVLALAGANGATLEDFARHEEDRSFFSDLLHPSAKAWLYYDQAIDRFYHSPD